MIAAQPVARSPTALSPPALSPAALSPAALSPTAQPSPGCGPGCVAAVTPAELLRLADDLRANGRNAAADATLRALFSDASPDVRWEARFRLAKSLVVRRRYAEAIGLLEQIVAERPNAAPVRLELARALALSGDRARSLREFARLQAGALPPKLARDVNQVVSTLRSSRRFGGSLEIGLAPDSNVNDATAASTIIIGGLPFTLDPSARRRSGIGVEAAGQMFWRVPLTGTTPLVIDAVGRGTVYRDGALDNGTVEASVGPEISHVRPALFVGRRWYLGQGYSWSWGGTAQWLHSVAKRAVLDVGTRLEHVAVERSTALDGTSYTVSVALERALRPSLFLRTSVFGNRYQARSAVFTTTSAGGAALLAKDFGPVSLYGKASYSHLTAPTSLLGGRRTDDRVELGGGLSLRRVRFLAASPVVRVTRVLNGSTVTLYDTSRTRVEVALSRPF